MKLALKLVANKALTLFVLLRYPRVPSQYRYFLRFRYLGKLRQLNYFVKDYLIRKPYKVIEFRGEFQQELLHVLPFAYWHHKNGTLKKTISTKGTKCLYFFSKDHEEKDHERMQEDNFNIDIPNAPHDFRLNLEKWRPVPLKEYYRNDHFIYDKPLCVIANRYNTEWGQAPISFFSTDLLAKLFVRLKENYQIIYNRPLANYISNDNSEVLDLKEGNWIRSEFPEIIQLPDLYGDHKSLSFNELQLKIYANCNHFISIHGGTATLASYFGGINVVYSKRGHEHFLNEFENVFPKVSGAKIIHCTTYEKVIDTVNDLF